MKKLLRSDLHRNFTGYISQSDKLIIYCEQKRKLYLAVGRRSRLLLNLRHHFQNPNNNYSLFSVESLNISVTF